MTFDPDALANSLKARIQNSATLKAYHPRLYPWLIDVDYWNWENAYRWLISASDEEVIAHAERLLDDNWDETREPYYVATF